MGLMGSLKTSLTSLGAAARAAPSSGVAEISTAWAKAVLTPPKSRARIASSKSWRLAMGLVVLGRRIGKLQPRRRIVVVVGGLAFGRDRDPVLLALGADLDRREIEHGSRTRWQAGAEDELVVEIVGQAAARPIDLADRRGDLDPVVDEGRIEGLHLQGYLPAGLGHGLGLDDALGNL